MSKCRYNDNPTLKQVIERNAGCSIDELLHPKANPYLNGLDACVQTIKAFKGNKITVVADYDADGIMAGCIMQLGLEAYVQKVLKRQDMEIKIRYPKRFSEGYGLSEKIIDEIDDGLLITVDNGIAAVKEIDAAKKKGLTVIVTDHHLPPADGIIPNADALLDPKATGDSEFLEYCGAGLAYRFIKELHIPKSEALLQKILIFAGIATVSDIVPLHGDNRNLVKRACELIEEGYGTIGLKILLKKLQMDAISADDFGFKLGPVINASGRLEDDGPLEVAKLLTYDDPFITDLTMEMEELADEIIKRNELRKDMVKISLSHINIDPNNFKVPIIMHDPSCSAGIVGIVAGNLSESYHVPAIVFAGDGEILKGSGRSEEINLKEMLDSASDLFIKYGGHAGAAGMTINKKNLDKLQERCGKYLTSIGFDIPSSSDVIYDIEIKEEEVADYIEKLETLAPFGFGNPAPIFKISGYNLGSNDKWHNTFKLLGSEQQHIKFWGEKGTQVIAFDMANKYQGGKSLDVYGSVSWNVFKGKYTPQISCIYFEDIEKKG